MLPPTNSFATFNAPTGAVSPPVVGTFKWVTTCDDARQQDYQVVFKAVDDGNPTPLAALKTVSIHVVAPAPKTLSALVKSGRIELSWVKAYECDNPIRAPRFRGFTIWRKEGCSGVTTDICGTDLAAQGFTIIADDVKTVQNGAYFYTDLTPERGKEYTYVVTAKLAELNSSNYPLRFIQSLPSNAVCVQVSRDIPLMLKVDVATTSTTAGTMNLVWTRPFAIDLDTLQNPGPYTYELQRATDFSGNTFVKVVSFTRQHYYQAIDTTYTDNGTAGNGGALNTAAHPYRYRVKFLVNGADSLGVSPAASSVYLKVVGTDSKNVLTWSETVPWTNARYAIYRRNAVTNTLDSIGNATSHIYADKGLTNGMQYCYMVRSVGGYHAGGLPTYTTNRSEEQCGTPIDTVPPCPLVLMVTNDCATLTAQAPASAFKNTLTWTVNPADSCANGIALFNVYYAPNKTAAFTKIATLPQPALRTYLHSPALSVAGCYYVTAVDSIKPNNGGGGNESKPSNIACVDNCPIYELPNIFTPNGDGVNDTYTPINPYRFVTRIELHIYNRWGAEVFTTTDPSINWDGRDRAGKDLAEGVYFYTCDVYENRIEGEVQRPDRLRGYIHLIRGE